MKRFLCLLIALTFLLGGCTFTGRNVDSLLRPPILSDEQNDIWKVLKKSDPENSIKLVYPQRGENRSAILLANVDDEPGDEAVVFFQTASAVSSAPVGLKILDKKDGEWVFVSETVLDGIQIEDVSLLNVGTGVPIMAVGLNYTSDGTHLIKILQFDGKEMHTVFSGNYQVKEFYDMDSDGNDDIFIVENPESEVKIWARAYRYENNDFKEIGAVTVNPEITHYVTVARGNTAQGKEAVFIDGYKGTELMTTEILTYDKEKSALVNLTYDGETPQRYPVDRAPVANSMDLTNDGIIEIPGVRPMPGYDETEEGTLYLTDWYHFTDVGFVKKSSAFVNTALGYIFTYPENWIGRVSAKALSENEIVFYEYNAENEVLGNELLHLRVATRSDWLSKKIPSEYQLIDAEGQIVYLAKISGAESSFALSISKVKEYFNLKKGVPR